MLPLSPLTPLITPPLVPPPAPETIRLGVPDAFAVGAVAVTLGWLVESILAHLDAGSVALVAAELTRSSMAVRSVRPCDVCCGLIGIGVVL